MTDQEFAMPSGPEELTPDWLTKTLRRESVLQRATVTSLNVADLGLGRGLTGRLARVGLQYDLAEPGAPASLIVKFPASPGPTLDLASRFRLYEREARFYQELAHRVELPTPRLYYGATPPVADGFVLLLEDISSGREGDLKAGCGLDQAKLILDSLAGMHAAWWNSPELDELSWLPAPNDAVTLELAAAVSAKAWKVFHRKLRDHLPPSLVSLGDRLKSDRSVLDRLATAPRTLVHADMRINNLMFANSASTKLCAVIDWQTAVRGRGPMDVASLFTSSLQPEERRVAEAELLPEYHRALEQNGVRGYSFEECWLDYRLAVINQFSQVIVLSSMLDIGSQMDDDVTAATGARLFSALLDLDLIELVPPGTRFGRWWSLLKRPVGRLA
jgi:hypothetical protein